MWYTGLACSFSLANSSGMPCCSFSVVRLGHQRRLLVLELLVLGGGTTSTSFTAYQPCSCLDQVAHLARLLQGEHLRLRPPGRRLRFGPCRTGSPALPPSSARFDPDGESGRTRRAPSSPGRTGRGRSSPIVLRHCTICTLRFSPYFRSNSFFRLVLRHLHLALASASPAAAAGGSRLPATRSRSSRTCGSTCFTNSSLVTFASSQVFRHRRLHLLRRHAHAPLLRLRSR